MSKKPYIFQEDSPNLVIVPTVYCYKPTPTKEKVEYIPTQILALNEADGKSASPSDACIKTDDGDKNVNNVLVNVSKVKKPASWATNYLQSIGGSSTKSPRSYHSSALKTIVPCKGDIEPKFDPVTSQPQANNISLKPINDEKTAQLRVYNKTYLSKDNTKAVQLKPKEASSLKDIKGTTQPELSKDASQPKVNSESNQRESKEISQMETNNKGTFQLCPKVQEPFQNKDKIKAVLKKSYKNNITSQPKVSGKTDQLNVKKEISRRKTNKIASPSKIHKVKTQLKHDTHTSKVKASLIAAQLKLKKNAARFELQKETTRSKTRKETNEEKSNPQCAQHHTNKENCKIKGGKDHSPLRSSKNIIPKPQKKAILISPIKPPSPLLKKADSKLQMKTLRVTEKKSSADGKIVKGSGFKNKTKHDISKPVYREASKSVSPIKSVVKKVKVKAYHNSDRPSDLHKDSDHNCSKSEKLSHTKYKDHHFHKSEILSHGLHNDFDNQFHKSGQSSHTSSEVDLRSKLKRKIPKKYVNSKDESRDYKKHKSMFPSKSKDKSFMPDENLIISFNAKTDNEEVIDKSPRVKTKPEKEKLSAKKHKKIKLEINISFQNSDTTDDESRKSEDEKSAHNDQENTDFSFLDDINIDEIVESLNDCERKIVTPGIGKIQPDLSEINGKENGTKYSKKDEILREENSTTYVEENVTQKVQTKVSVINKESTSHIKTEEPSPTQQNTVNTDNTFSKDHNNILKREKNEETHSTVETSETVTNTSEKNNICAINSTNVTYVNITLEGTKISPPLTDSRDEIVESLNDCERKIVTPGIGKIQPDLSEINGKENGTKYSEKDEILREENNTIYVEKHDTQKIQTKVSVINEESTSHIKTEEPSPTQQNTVNTDNTFSKDHNNTLKREKNEETNSTVETSETVTNTSETNNICAINSTNVTCVNITLEGTKISPHLTDSRVDNNMNATKSSNSLRIDTDIVQKNTCKKQVHRKQDEIQSLENKGEDTDIKNINQSATSLDSIANKSVKPPSSIEISKKKDGDVSLGDSKGIFDETKHEDVQQPIVQIDLTCEVDVEDDEVILIKEVDMEPVLVLDTDYDIAEGIKPNFKPVEEEIIKVESDKKETSENISCENKLIDDKEIRFSQDNTPPVEDKTQINEQNPRDSANQLKSVNNTKPQIANTKCSPKSQAKSINMNNGVTSIPGPGSQHFVKDAHVLDLEDKLHKHLGEKCSIAELIHVGKFSTIYRYESKNGCNNTLKVLKSTHIKSGIQKENMFTNFQKRILEENYNCVRLMKGFPISRSWCFVMEYYPLNLHQVLYENKSKFPIDKIQNLSSQLVTAVTILRNHNIIHSDIKPHHILVNSSETQLKLGGFDDAFYFTCSRMLPSVGTVNYRAPELIIGYPADYSIDVWSTALVMYEMATSKQLFPGQFNNDILYKQMCTLDTSPFRMLQQSEYRNVHFLGNSFARIVGFKGETKVLIREHEFVKRDRIFKTLFKMYNSEWNTLPKAKQFKDRMKLNELSNLLYEMLAMHPKTRISIEFVFANPFIYKAFTCN